MAGTNQFLAFATGGGANVESQAAYAADPNLPLGAQPGIASSSFNNKALRQANYIASQIAQFLVNQTGLDCLDDATPANIQNVMSQVWPSPTGSILAFAGSAAPTGYLLCDGSSVLRATYANLFAIIGTTYGTVDGTHFNLPNTQGIFLRGAGSQTISAITYSATRGTAQNDTTKPNGLAVASHVTGITLQGFNGGTTGSGQPLTGNNGGTPSNPAVTDGGHIHALTGDAETRPANLGINYIIKI